MSGTRSSRTWKAVRSLRADLAPLGARGGRPALDLDERTHAWALNEAPGAAMPLFFPEAACLEVLVISDARLHRLSTRLIAARDGGGTGVAGVRPRGDDRTENAPGTDALPC